MIQAGSLHIFGPFLFKQAEKSKIPPARPKSKPDSKTKSSTKRKKGDLYCNSCKIKITSNRFKIKINDFYEHTFPNPNGIVFHIGCFREAQSILRLGNPSTEWSWFPGFSWEVVACANCASHLGWYYESSAKSFFFGFILGRLSEL